MTLYTIKEIPEEERPRERLLRHGAEALSSVEMIAILLGSGTRNKSVIELSRELLCRFETLQGLADATLNELQQVRGMGQAKAVQLKAALSLAGRLKAAQPPAKFPLSHPRDAWRLVRDKLEKEKREVFLALLLDTRGCLIQEEVISIGTLSSVLVHPRELFYPAIRHKASSLILVHNHPSGDPTPSPQDIEVTENLAEVGRIMEIPVLDHVIIGLGRFFSLREENCLSFQP